MKKSREKKLARASWVELASSDTMPLALSAASMSAFKARLTTYMKKKGVSRMAGTAVKVRTRQASNMTPKKSQSGRNMEPPRLLLRSKIDKGTAMIAANMDNATAGYIVLGCSATRRVLDDGTESETNRPR